MPRRPDLPCARCGKLLWRGSTSLPEGQATCRACRNVQRETPRPCAHCGAAFAPASVAQVVCSESCRSARMREGASILSGLSKQPGPCDDCGALTTRGGNQAGRFCAACSRKRAKERNARKDQGWTKSALLPSVRVLAARDNYVCHVCGGDVDMALPFNDRMAPTRDHIVPRRLGGGHDPSNLKLAHRGCNSRRGAPLPV